MLDTQTSISQAIRLRVRARQMPDSWQVFRTSRTRFLLSGVLCAVLTLVCTAVALFLFPHPRSFATIGPSYAFAASAFVAFVAACGAVYAFYCLSLARQTWWVLMPDSFFAHDDATAASVSFADVSNISLIGTGRDDPARASLVVTYTGNRERHWPVSLTFQPTRTTAEAVAAAFAAYVGDETSGQ